MKPIKDDEVEQVLAQHSIKAPREGLRERVLTTGRTAWNQVVPTKPAFRLQISWTLNGWLAIAASILFLLNLGVDSYNRTAFHSRFPASPSMSTVACAAYVNAYKDALRQQQQAMRDLRNFYR
jgi:hypothetical protein